jgi:uncharacterized protein (TIGR03437 family)
MLGVSAFGATATRVEVAHWPAQIGQDVLLRAAVYQAASGRGVSLGTMAFVVDGATVAGCEAVWVYESSGAAECMTKFATLGAHEFKAKYSGTPTSYAPSEATVTVQVGKLDPSTYLAFIPPHPVYGSGLIVHALVMGAKGMPDPTGTFTFLEHGKELVTRSIEADGRALLDFPLTAGTHRLEAVYNGDDYYLAEPEVWIDITVGKGPPTVAISSTPAQLGQPVTITASVLPAGAGGTVTFTGVAGCGTVAVKDGLAQCVATFRQLGTVSAGAEYSGDANLTSGSASMKLNVARLVAGVYAAVFPATPVYGQAVTLGAQVLGAQGAAPPTGTVSFGDAMGGGAVAALDATGHAQSIVAPAAGLRTFVATYNGDANYATSQSVANAMVAKSGTATTLAATAGSPLTATVKAVAPGGGIPTGSVRFVRDGITLGSAALTAGVATLATSATGNVRAEYAGDFNFLPSVSATASVSAPQVGLKIAADRNPAPAGKVTFTVTGALSAGTVQVTVDGVAVGGGSLSQGSVTMTAELGPGSHAVVATYSGDAVYAAASASIVESVTSPAGTITLTANPASPVYGEPITLTAGASGTVQFLDEGVTLGSGEGAMTVSRLAAGSHTITATAGTASAELVLTVAKARTTTSVRVSGGQAAAQVVAVAPGSGVPTGPVRFADGATGTAFAVVPLESGMASAAVPAGVSLATAAYEGDANFSASVSGAAGLLTVLNAASYDGAGFAAGEIVTVFGSNLAGTVRVTDSAGVSRGADVLYGSATQMSVVLPEGMASGVATLTIGGMSAALPVRRTAPGLFTVDASGKGVAAAQVVTVHADGTQDAGSADAIDVGGAGDAVYLILYGTGVRHFADRVVCTVAGRPATVAFAGAQGGSAGLDQVNVLLPAELKGAGRVELVVTADGVASNAVTVVFR